LEVDSHGAINANDFVRTNTGIRWNIAPRIGDAHVGRIVVDHVVGALDGCGDQSLGERRSLGNERRVDLG